MSERPATMNDVIAETDSLSRDLAVVLEAHRRSVDEQIKRLETRVAELERAATEPRS